MAYVSTPKATAPPRAKTTTPLKPPLWTDLPHRRKAEALIALSRMVARGLQPPPIRQEVTNERA
jgi:hypothetical protein